MVRGGTCGGSPRTSAAAFRPAIKPEAADSTDASPQLVDVTLSNFTIDMPTELAAGPVRFSIVNNGAAPHSFVLEGQGIRKTLANTLQPGDSARLNASLSSGLNTCVDVKKTMTATGMTMTAMVLN